MSRHASPAIAAPHRRIALDVDRRHLVVGDLHGRHETFLRLLEAANHDPARDAVYSVGDLIDRGPDSVSVVRFFEAGHRHAGHRHVVRGNHEQMVLDPKRWEGVWSRPEVGGPATLASLDAHGLELDWLRAAVAALPVCLDVGDAGRDGAFRLVHAESPFRWRERRLRRELDAATPLHAGAGRLLWGRDDVETVLRLGADGGDVGPRVRVHADRSTRAVFSGHTPTRDVVGAHGAWWIDTAAGGTLTCVDALTLERYRVPIAEGDRF